MFSRRGAFFVVSARTGLRVLAVTASAALGFALGPTIMPPPGWLVPPGVPGMPAGSAAPASRNGQTPAPPVERMALLQRFGAWVVARATEVAWPAAPTAARAGEPGPSPSRPSPAPVPSDRGSEDGSPGRPALAPPPSLQRPRPPEKPPDPPARPRPSGPARAAVWVAVYHTHTSEMYRTPDFHPSDPLEYHRFGTTDTGVVRVGKALVDALNALGIPAVHITTIHDYPSHDLAYVRSMETARALVERYPSLRLLIDLHRDAPQEGGDLETSVDGESVAQLALVVGTGRDGAEEKSNLAVARALAAELDSRFPGLLRRLILRPGRYYNQQVHPGALLIEVGSYRSQEAAARRSALLLAQGIAALLLKSPFPRSAWS
ncbi:MAG: stage II sporulation protein P [Limnochordaceae bacterium]|nr:stage II sporulation protein P [Limnochordaceae bacterium]